MAASAVVATFVISASTTAAAASAAATAAHHACHFSQFFIGRFAAGHYLTDKVQVASGQRMVHIHDDHVVFHFHNTAVDALSFSGHQGYDGTCCNVFVVKLAVNQKNLFRQFDDMVIVIFAVGIGAGDGKVELVTGIQVLDLLFESVQGQSQSGDELEGMFYGSLFGKFTLSVFDGV